MTDLHPIVPSEGLREEWESEWHHYRGQDTYEEFMAKQAAQWGADAELDACCDWLVRNYNYPEAGNPFRDARRPKPPIKADQALAVLNTAPKAGTPTVILDIDQFDTILLALKRMKEMEALPND